MNKILPIILVVVLSGCAAPMMQSGLDIPISKTEQTQYFIDKFLKDRELSNIEGIWRLDQGKISWTFGPIFKKYYIMIIKNQKESNYEYSGIVTRGSYCLTGPGSKIFEFDGTIESNIFNGIAYYAPPACTGNRVASDFIIVENGQIKTNGAMPIWTLTKVYPKRLNE